MESSARSLPAIRIEPRSRVPAPAAPGALGVPRPRLLPGATGHRRPLQAVGRRRTGRSSSRSARNRVQRLLGSVAKVPSEGIPYPVFAFSGLVCGTSSRTRLARLSEHRRQLGADLQGLFPACLPPSSLSFPAGFRPGLAMVVVFAPGRTTGSRRRRSARPLLVPSRSPWRSVSAVALGAERQVSGHAGHVPFAIQIGLFVTPVVYSFRLVHNPADPLRAQPDGRGPRGFRWCCSRERLAGRDRADAGGRRERAADHRRAVLPAGRAEFADVI